MKTNLGIIAVMVLIGFSACEKENDSSIESLEGIYKGTLITSINSTNQSDDGTVEVVMLDSGLIEIHCYGGEFDSTMMLNYFDYNDSIMVCLTGDDFEEMYGHQYGNAHGTGMMGNHQNYKTNWEHHMGDEHNENDEHFGGFGMLNHSFNYSFIMNERDSTYHLNFHGIKQ